MWWMCFNVAWPSGDWDMEAFPGRQARSEELMVDLCWVVGQVTYQTELFLDKNKDYVVAEHQSLLGSSTCPFVAGLFPKSTDEGSKSSYKFSSIGTRFKVGKDDVPGR